MLCPKCDGKGYIEIPNMFDGEMEKHLCNVCMGTGDKIEYVPKEQTNEEWFTNLSTEEKAETLLRFYYQDVCMNTKQSVINWLKEVHKE